MRTGRSAQATPKATIADHIDRVSDILFQLRGLAGNERRSHGQTEQLLDELDATGSYLKRVARGGA